MVKKLLTIILGLAMTFGALAQRPSSHPDSQKSGNTKDIFFWEGDIEFWVGTGSNTSMVIIAWDENPPSGDFALVWGVRWSGSVTALDLLDSIVTHDSRLSYTFLTAQGANYMEDILYDDGELIGPSGSGWCYLHNNVWAQNPYNMETMEDGDIIEISSSCMFTLTEASPATDPNPHTDPDPPTDPCATAIALPYEEDFSGYIDNTAIRPYMAGAIMPECWTAFGNGTTQYYYTANSQTSVYFGGVGYSTSTNSFGAIAANDAFLSLIGSQIYTGDNASHIASMNSIGTCRYAILPAFDQPLSQTVLTFDRRTSMSGAHLVVGYVTGDTSTFVGLDTLEADNRVLHNDTVHFNQYTCMPDNARLTFKWEVSSSTNSTTGPGYRYCGIDNLTVAPDTATTPEPPVNPVDATIAHSEVLYWVGEGSNEALFLVSYAQPDTAFAWGYRFNSGATIQQMVDDIDAADPRLEIVGNPSDGGDIHFALDNGDILALSPVDPERGYNFWWTNLNGLSVVSMTTVLQNGDYFKYGDLNSATDWDFQNGYYMQEAWTKVPTPVSVPDTTGDNPGDDPDPQPEHGPFCGPVGTVGCDAIAADSVAIVAWATGCSLSLGTQNIAVEGSPVVSYGTSSAAVGACSMTDNLSVVSLGDGGSATLTFAHPIRNGEGPDFAVYENSFNDYFLELAFVEVSSDGERFVRFPATSLTSTETQVASSVDPTYINNLAGKYRYGYGTPFDLEELRDSTGIDIDSIVYVRIIDAVGSINPLYATYDAYGHIVNDPWPTNSYSGGFDLDGVAVLYENISEPEPPVNPVDATIAHSEIIYWVGEGSNEALFFVSYAQPDTAFAWGYRFNSGATIQQMVDDIDAADPRLEIVGNPSDGGDIHFAFDNGDTLALSPVDPERGYNFWWTNLNGVSVASMTTVLHNGDYFKYGDLNSATDWDFQNGYYMQEAWTKVPTPVSVPDTTGEEPGPQPHDGIAEVTSIVEHIWPNPTANRVNVQLSQPCEAVLYDLTGRQMATFSLKEGLNTLDLSDLNNGIYMLRTEGTVSKILKK